MRFLPTENQDYVIARKVDYGKARPKSQMFTVAKFNMGEAPDAIYYVTVNKRFVSCTCPRYEKTDPPKPRCRHMIMVALWVLNGDKDPEPAEVAEVVNREYFK